MSICCSKISPEISQAVIRTEERAEDSRICKKDVTGPIALWRHPEKHIELGIALLDEWMRLGPIDWLSRQNMDRVVTVSHGVVRQVHVKVESGDTVEKSLPIEVTCFRQWRQFLRQRVTQRPQTIAILDWCSESLHQSTRVFSKVLLTRHQSVTMVVIFHVAHLWIFRQTDFMMWAKHQTRSFTLEKVFQSFNLFRSSILTGNIVVQPEYQQRISVCQHAFIEREFESCLIDALKYRHDMSGCFSYKLLEGCERPEKQLQSPSDPLLKLK